MFSHHFPFGTPFVSDAKCSKSNNGQEDQAETYLAQRQQQIITQRLVEPTNTIVTKNMLLLQISFCERELEKLKIASHRIEHLFPDLAEAGIQAYLHAYSNMDELAESYGEKDIPKVYNQIKHLTDATSAAIKVIDIHSNVQTMMTTEAHQVRQNLLETAKKVKTHSRFFRIVGLACVLGGVACLAFLTAGLAVAVGLPLILGGSAFYLKGMSSDPAPTFFKITKTAEKLHKIKIKEIENLSPALT